MRMRIQPLSDGTNEVDIKLLPDGRTLIHWLRECDDGPIKLKGHPKLREAMGRPADGSYVVVCNPKQTTVNSQKRGSTRFMCITSGDPAAVTCPQCLAAPETIEALKIDLASPKAAQIAMDTAKIVGV